MYHIVILVHHNDKLEQVRYFMPEFAKIWREKGLKVTILHGIKEFVPADLAILHVDLTVVDEAYRKFIGRYPRVLNGKCTNISKSFFSKNILRLEDHYLGPVIVKTDANCGGIQEAALCKYKNKILSYLPWSLANSLAPQNYRVYQVKEDVPYLVWFNRHLVVEKFKAERQDNLYVCRNWVFFGDRETNALNYVENPIAKADHAIKREVVKEVPSELRAIRASLGFDFGKFDYGIVNGEVVLYDINKTPSLGNLPMERFLPNVKLLAEGIENYVKN